MPPLVRDAATCKGCRQFQEMPPVPRNADYYDATAVNAYSPSGARGTVNDFHYFLRLIISISSVVMKGLDLLDVTPLHLDLLLLVVETGLLLALLELGHLSVCSLE